MRLQNAIAALVFTIFLTCCVCMQLLNVYPASETLWHINITYAREARPVLELLSYLPFASLVQNCLILLALIALCGLAIRHRSRILTAATTHAALYAMIFAGIASYSRTFVNLQAASINPAEIAGLAGALDQSQLALTAIIAVLVVTCLSNHYQIISDLLANRFSKRFGAVR